MPSTLTSESMVLTTAPRSHRVGLEHLCQGYKGAWDESHPQIPENCSVTWEGGAGKMLRALGAQNEEFAHGWVLGGLSEGHGD